MQQVAEEREASMDDLISQMAQILLQENKQQVGIEVANEAVAELQKEDRERRGGKVNEKVPKTTTRGRKSTK